MAGGLEMIMEGLQQHRDDVSFCTYAMCLLENLSRVEANVEPMRIIGVAPAVISCITHLTEHACVQPPGLNCMSNMVYWSKACALEGGRNSSIEAALDAIQTHYQNEEVVAAALRYLGMFD